MNKIFIVDCFKNPGLLKFIQTKVFFDAKNNSTDWASDCVVVNSINDIQESCGIVINSNQFITTTFRAKHKSVEYLLDARNDTDLIEFDPTYSYDIKQRPPFKAGSKQLYILENLYKVMLKSTKLVYLDNTEQYSEITCNPKHFYGLASGWKSVRLARDIGIDTLDTIVIYDKCSRQLEYQQYLHSCKHLPDSIDVAPPVCGEYSKPEDLVTFWPTWNKTKVQFKLLDLFETPIFPDNSLVWVSNVFKYEPTIFNLGWEECKSAQQRLKNANQSSIIIH